MMWILYVEKIVDGQDIFQDTTKSKNKKNDVLGENFEKAIVLITLRLEKSHADFV